MPLKVGAIIRLEIIQIATSYIGLYVYIGIMQVKTYLKIYFVS